VAFLAGIFGQGIRVPIMKENNSRHLMAIGRIGYLDMDEVGSLFFLIRFYMQRPHETENNHQRQQQAFWYPGQPEMRHDPIQKSQNSGSFSGQ
jgi:hypothetical protein